MIARDWLIIEATPWRSREELEAEVERLRELGLRQTDQIVGLLIAEAQRGRPRAKGRVHPRTERRHRAKPPDQLREMLRALGTPTLWNLTTGEVRPLTPEELRESKVDAKKLRT